MSWKNARDAKRDIRAFSSEQGIEAVAVAKNVSEHLSEEMTDVIRKGDIRDLWSVIKPRGMPENAEKNILSFTLHELIRHINHVRILSGSLSKAVEDPDNFAQALIMTLKEYRQNPDISDLIKEFGLDSLEDYEEDVFLDDEEEDEEYYDEDEDDEDEYMSDFEDDIDYEDEDDDFDFLDDEEEEYD